MPKKSQFQNLVLQHTLQEHMQQPTQAQPSITLPIKPEALVPLPPAQPLFSSAPFTRSATEITANRSGDLMMSTPVPGIPDEMRTPDPSGTILPSSYVVQTSQKKKLLLRGTAILVSALLVLAIYLTWHSTTPTDASPTITQQADSSGFANTPDARSAMSPTTTDASTDSSIQVYIVGAVKHPGVYTLPAGSRVYQLIQAAGGTQANADLVSINLAAKLSDGQEIYVLSVGETPPAYTSDPSSSTTTSTPAVSSGALVNINTTDETTMEKELHISSTTAKKIIDYRTQHGAYTSVDQLAQVVSKTIYDRIKSLVTV